MLDEAEMADALAHAQPSGMCEQLVATPVVVSCEHQLDLRDSRKCFEEPRMVLVRPHVRRVDEEALVLRVGGTKAGLAHPGGRTPRACGVQPQSLGCDVARVCVGRTPPARPPRRALVCEPPEHALAAR